MQVIVNLPAIVLLIIIIALAYMLGFISPAFRDMHQSYFWLIFFIVGCWGEMKKLRGRIVFLPMWIIAIFAFILLAKSEYFEEGRLDGILLATATATGGFFFMRYLARKKWESARGALSELYKHLNEQVDSHYFYELMKKAFYVPAYLNSDNFILYLIIEKLDDLGYKHDFHQPEANQHYLDFIELLKPCLTVDEYQKNVTVFEDSLQKIKNHQPAHVYQYMFENIENLLNEKEKEFANEKIPVMVM